MTAAKSTNLNSTESANVDFTEINEAHVNKPHDAPLPTGLTCLVTIARAHGIATDAVQLLHEFGESAAGFSANAILHAARHLGLFAEQRRVKPERLEKIATPAIFREASGDFAIIGRVETNDAGTRLLIHRPTSAQPVWVSVEEFSKYWTGELILLASRASLVGELARFDFSWFIPAMVKYRKLLLEVLMVSIVLQLFALVTPLFFQVVMDKVLVHRGFSTLNVIAIGLLVVSVFEVSLNGLRSYVHTHTCSRIDVELGARLFRHLLALPLPWFQARRAGDAVARVRELEKIRQFLTGNGITLVLDLAFSLVFIGVMLIYSPVLTLLVVLSLPCYLLLSIIATPILRKRLDDQFKYGAENQAFLVETVTAIGTVKAMAVEPRWCTQWEQQLAAYVKAAFRAAMIGNWAGNSVSLVSKLVTVGTMWLGAHLVIDGQMSVGQLIAFNMLAGHVAAPVMRLAQMWSDFQQLGVSVERIGEILNTATESTTNGATLPPIKGHIAFDHVFFRYRADGKDILSNIHLMIRPGEKIGIVGRSGSGKSTLTLLLQRLHTAQHGRVLIDGIDIALADPASLRRQIGVVPQESQLFRGTIRQNIALADPGAPLNKVIQMARLAGAHGFITELPEGYETLVGEHGTGLSGGQKQRIAIARALMRDPRILIFDEATSALDYESERVIQGNMGAICANRTVIIIAHRLSAVRDCDRILVLEHGRLVEQGAHNELLTNDDGIYARLYRMQAA
jgi:ATP-binding cassette, subfamily B, bacterial HlyB/CyaB